jgi:AraC-type transcriptional regulator N-terminus
VRHGAGGHRPGRQASGPGDRVYECAAGQYLIASVDLPVTGHVIDPAPGHPPLSFGMTLEPAAIAELLLQAARESRSATPRTSCSTPTCGCCGCSLAAGPEGTDPLFRPDRFLVSLAVLSLFSVVAEEQPIICVVDDEQWLDRASVQVLAFVARRLRAESVGLVFSTRSPSDDVAGLPELMVEGLTRIVLLGRGP